MAQLLFFDADHRYELDGVELPSVSEITRFISREIYGSINQYTLDHAANRGTRVHKACELIDKYGEAEIDEDIAPRVSAYIDFLRDRKPAWTHIEKAMHSPARRYAGTIDRVGVVGGETWLIDLKAQEQIKKPLVTAQVNAYAIMAEENGLSIDRLGCLQLTNGGKYRFHELPREPATIEACLSLHTALEPKRSKRRTAQ